MFTVFSTFMKLRFICSLTKSSLEINPNAVDSVLTLTTHFCVIHFILILIVTYAQLLL